MKEHRPNAADNMVATNIRKSWKYFNNFLNIFINVKLACLRWSRIADELAFGDGL